MPVSGAGYSLASLLFGPQTTDVSTRRVPECFTPTPPLMYAFVRPTVFAALLVAIEAAFFQPRKGGVEIHTSGHELMPQA